MIGRKIVARRAVGAIGIAILVGVAVACQPTGPGAVPPGPPGFRTGYTDGCTSGYADAGRRGMEDVFVQNEGRFASDADYKEGWLQGYAACYREERDHPMMGIR